MPSPIPWQTKDLRGTFFQDTTTVDGAHLWENTVGSAADEINHRPSDGVTRVQGRVEFGAVALQVAPGRLDWHLLGHPQGPNTRASAGELTTAIDHFSRLLSNFATRADDTPVSRVAVAANVAFEVANQQQGLKRLLAFLPSVRFDHDEDIRDFQYQVNRRRRSAHHQLVYNRIARWATSTEQVFILGPAGMSKPRVVDVIAATFDINNVPVENGHAVEDLSGVVNEQKDLLIELAEYGEKA